MNKLKLFKKLGSQFKLTTKLMKISSLKDVIKNNNQIKIYSFKEILKNANKVKSQQLQNIKKELATVNLKNINPKYWIQYLQDKVVQVVGENDPSDVVLKQSGFWAGAITWVLLGGTAFAIGWLAIAKTDEVVIAVGRLEPKSGVVDVQMPLEGIAREILISEGERVQKGQVLILSLIHI